MSLVRLGPERGSPQPGILKDCRAELVGQYLPRAQFDATAVAMGRQGANLLNHIYRAINNLFGQSGSTLPYSCH